MTKDMDLLRSALSILLDDSQPIEERLDQLVSSLGTMVTGFNRATITAILLVVYPGEYGVWNNTSEQGLKELRIFPEFERGSSFGDRYLAVNSVLKRLSSELEIPLWDLDTLWWVIFEQQKDNQVVAPFADEEQLAQRFGLEKYLQHFLKDNWERLADFSDWELYVDQDETVGFEYFTDIGRIDLLARHRSKPEWLVIELKRDQSSDETVGQVLRYMGWIQENLAKEVELVRGLVISRSADDRIRYALHNTRNVEHMLYEVDFHLKKLRDQ